MRRRQQCFRSSTAMQFLDNVAHVDTRTALSRFRPHVAYADSAFATCGIQSFGAHRHSGRRLGLRNAFRVRCRRVSKNMCNACRELAAPIGAASLRLVLRLERAKRAVESHSVPLAQHFARPREQSEHSDPRVLAARPMYACTVRLYPSYLLPSASTRPHLVHFYALYPRHLYRNPRRAL